MSVEQVARDFISNMTSAEKVKAMLTPDAMASGGVLPQAMPAKDAFNMVDGLNAGFPDLKFEVQQVTVNGNQATVKAKVSGTNTGTIESAHAGNAAYPADREKGIGGGRLHRHRARR